MRHPSYVLVERLYDLRRKVILHLSTRGKLETSLGDPACSGVRRAVWTPSRESGEGACTRAERIEWVLTAGARRQGGRARWPGLNLKYSEGSRHEGSCQTTCQNSGRVTA